MYPVGVPKTGRKGDQSAFKYCTFDGFTLVFTFHPGASPAPYWDEYQGLRTSQQRIQDVAKQIQQTFGRGPDAAVVDSSLWDISSWWLHDGKPAPWPYPRLEFLIQEWCHRTIPTFLDFVQDLVPHTRIAFRTPFPGAKACHPHMYFLCNGPAVVHGMTGCLKTSLINTRLYDKYDLLDVNALALQEAQGHPITELYLDDIHPKPALNAAYMSAILKWVDTP